MALRGETHARAESVVRGWIYEIRELGHSYETSEIRLGLLLWVPRTHVLGLTFCEGD